MAYTHKAFHQVPSTIVIALHSQQFSEIGAEATKIPILLMKKWSSSPCYPNCCLSNPPTDARGYVLSSTIFKSTKNIFTLKLFIQMEERQHNALKIFVSEKNCGIIPFLITFNLDRYWNEHVRFVLKTLAK